MSYYQMLYDMDIQDGTRLANEELLVAFLNSFFLFFFSVVSIH